MPNIRIVTKCGYNKKKCPKCFRYANCIVSGKQKKQGDGK